MTAKRKRKPAYSLHKPSGQARVRIHGKDHYLGPYDSPESHERYDDLIAQWRVEHCVSDRYMLTIDELALLYLEHAKRHYRKNGEETSEVHCVRSTLRYLIAAAGTTRAREFGPKLLKAVRERTINGQRAIKLPQPGQFRVAFLEALTKAILPFDFHRQDSGDNVEVGFGRIGAARMWNRNRGSLQASDGLCLLSSVLQIGLIDLGLAFEDGIDRFGRDVSVGLAVQQGRRVLPVMHNNINRTRHFAFAVENRRLMNGVPIRQVVPQDLDEILFVDLAAITIVDDVIR